MSHIFDKLNNESYVSLTTYRKSGEAMPTPVWFTREGDTLYVYTILNSGKVKRVRNNGNVVLAACDMRGTIHGEAFEAQATFADKNDFKRIERLFDQKYNIMKKVFGVMAFFSKLIGKPEGERTYIAVRA